MRLGTCLLVGLLLASPATHAARAARPKATATVTSPQGKALDLEQARTIAAHALRSSPKYGLPADIELKVGDGARIAPNAGRPVTGKGGFVITHEATHDRTPTRYTTMVDSDGVAHDAGASPVELHQKVRGRLRYGSLLTGQNLVQAGLTVGLGLLQIPNFIGGGSSASATTALTGATLALLIGNTTKLFFDASRAYRDGVNGSITQSVQFIKDRQDPATRTATYPSLAETYVFYKQKLSELSPGAMPIPLAEFSEKMWAYGF